MTLVTYASLLILVVTVGWSIVLFARLTDPRLRALTALLLAVAVSRIVVILDPNGSWTVARSVPVDEGNLYSGPVDADDATKLLRAQA